MERLEELQQSAPELAAGDQTHGLAGQLAHVVVVGAALQSGAYKRSLVDAVGVHLEKQVPYARAVPGSGTAGWFGQRGHTCL